MTHDTSSCYASVISVVCHSCWISQIRSLCSFNRLNVVILGVVVLIDVAPICLLGYKIPKLPKMFDFYVNANLNDYDSSGKKANVNDSFNTFLMKMQSLSTHSMELTHKFSIAFLILYLIIKYTKLYYKHFINLVQLSAMTFSETTLNTTI